MASNQSLIPDGRLGTLDLDDTDDNADWPKRAFDFPGVTTAPALRAVLADMGVPLDQFRRSAAYRSNLDRLTWLADL